MEGTNKEEITFKHELKIKSVKIEFNDTPVHVSFLYSNFLEI